MSVKNTLIKKFETYPNNNADIPLQRKNRHGKSTFSAKLSSEGIEVDNLGGSPLLKWAVFEETVELLESLGGSARKGNAYEKLGDDDLTIDTIEGHLAKVVYGVKEGDAVFRRITPISGILVWAGICQSFTGGLSLNKSKSF